MQIHEFVPSPTLTTFRVGGTVRRVITVESGSEVRDAVLRAQSFGLPVVPLGGGSNMLLPDGVLDVTAIQFAPATITRHGLIIRADAGVSWDTLVEYVVEHSLAGLENLSSIPGTVGGAVVQNIGAYGASLSQTLLTVDVFDCADMTTRTFHVSDCRLGYRTSRFKHMQDRYLITHATFLVSENQEPNLSYVDLAHTFAGQHPTLSQVRQAVSEIRAQKFPPLAVVGCAGSYFLNPVVTRQEATEIQKKFPTMPVFELPEGGVKIPLGWYFDHVLHIRGHREGFVEAWRAQALVLAAHPGARASDVREFAKKISARAEHELGISIHSEVREF